MSSDNSKDSLMNQIHGNNISKWDEELDCAIYGNLSRSENISQSSKLATEGTDEETVIPKPSVSGINNSKSILDKESSSSNGANRNINETSNSLEWYEWFNIEWNEWTPNAPRMDVDWNETNLVTSTPKKNQESIAEVMTDFSAEETMISAGALEKIIAFLCH